MFYTQKTAEQLARFAEEVLDEKMLYAWGACGQRLQAIYKTLSLSHYYLNVNPTGFKKLTEIYNRGENPQVIDCHGIVDGCKMEIGDEVIYNSSFDYTANYDLELVKKTGVKGINWGSIETMPDIRGIGVHKDGHFGIYVGNGMVIDIYQTGLPARKMSVKLGGWTSWLEPYGILFPSKEEKPETVTYVDYRAINIPETGLWRRREPFYAPNTIDQLVKGQTFRAIGKTQDNWLQIASGGWIEEQYCFALSVGTLPEVTKPTQTIFEQKPIVMYKYTLTRELRFGSKGEDVVYLQKVLNSLGYNCGVADGDFGTKTKRSVKSFQASHNITSDGVVGEKTATALNWKFNNG